MGKTTWVWLAFLLLGLSNSLDAARIFGTVFDEDLQPTRAAVQINTTPEQQLISTTGAYEFTVQAGTYRMSAVGDNSSAEKTILIQDEGDFRIDLILLPGVPMEDAVLADLLDVPEVNEPDADNAEPFPLLLLAILAGIAVLAAAYVHRDRLPFFRRGQKSQTPSASVSPVASDTPSRIFTADQNKVMQTLSTFGNRASQKDLRKALHFWSEAKVSMELTELEDVGAIRKIKKGRGNIIRKA